VDTIVLDSIGFQIDLHQLLERLHAREGRQYIEEIKALVSEAQAIGRPRSLYKVAFVEARGDDYVVLDDVMFTSRVLRVNLNGTYRVFAYAATCGVELHDWAHSVDDLLHRYWADTISEMALRSAMKALEDHLVERYRPGGTATMSPGRLPDWPLQEQRPLFTLLGNPRDSIGVHLTDTFLMIPTKSVSGIRFPTEESFESCALCPRNRCPGRRAPYDRDLYDRKYRQVTDPAGRS